MGPSDLSQEDHAAIRVAFEWAIESWDWEMPTRTGLELAEFQAAALAWQEAIQASMHTSTFAALGAVREFCEAHPDAPALLGVSRQGLEALLLIRQQIT